MSNYQSRPTTSNEDCVGKILEANSLEKAGEIDKAVALYQEVIELDRDGNYGAVAQQAIQNLQQFSADSNSSKTKTSTEQVKTNASWWQKLSLRWKVTTLAIALSTFPVIGIGAISYYLTNQSISEQIATAEESQAIGLADKANRFMFERYGDIQIIAKAGLFSNPTIRESTTREQKDKILQNYLKSYFVYDSIVGLDLQENVSAQSKGSKTDNHRGKDYIQKVLQTGKTHFSLPQISSATGELVIYVASPIIDEGSQQMVGVASARMPVKHLQAALSNYSANEQEYDLVDGTGTIFVSSTEAKLGTLVEQDFPEINAIIKSGEADSILSKDTVKNTEQLISYSPLKTLGEMTPLDWGAVIGIETDKAFAVEKQLLFTLTLGTALTTIVVAGLAAYLSYRGTLPLIKSTNTVHKLGQGELDVRMDIIGADELADLGSNINLMAEQIQDLIKTQEKETRQQRQEKERLQQGVMNLLLDVEGAQKGDLTVRAQMNDGAVGSIADAFNATIGKLRSLLEQVQTVSNEVGELSLTGENSVRQLSEAAVTQAEEIDIALSNIAEINESVQNVAGYAQEAAEIAHQGLIQAKEGDAAMDSTVNSIEKIRTTVAGTSKQVKQLAESSQEIAQIVDIISGISEKTNLLAFNASVEAARAGEHGEGFRIVAEEVRRLADRITDSTKDIQQLVSTIQKDTTAVLQGMETSTTEVVTGSELVRKTKQNLQNLANTSEKIDMYLQSISTSTIDQTNTARQVNEKITGIATIARNNSNEAQNVVKSLRTLVEESETLQESLSQFKLQA